MTHILQNNMRFMSEEGQVVGFHLPHSSLQGLEQTTFQEKKKKKKNPDKKSQYNHTLNRVGAKHATLGVQ